MTESIFLSADFYPSQTVPHILCARACMGVCVHGGVGVCVTKKSNPCGGCSRFPLSISINR